MSNWKPVNRKIPNVKKIEVNELSGEYRVKISYRYKDPYGNNKRTDTHWIVGLTLEKAIEKAHELGTDIVAGRHYRDVVIPAMADLRAVCDEMELNVAEKYWPYPSYGDILYSVRD